MIEWMPIETAPKGGSCIILGNECGSWIGKYMPVYVSGFVPSNPWASMMLNCSHMGLHFNLTPSHWMPLPEPPK